MLENKKHWYDGWFYDLLIAPNQDRLFSEIRNLIEKNSAVIDVGCGTGRLSFFIEDKVSNMLGIDLSKKNIEKANQKLSRKPTNKISFLHTSVSKLISQKFHYDYAVMTYVIHEVNEEERVKLLKEISFIADKIIIGDYHIIQKNFLWRWLNELVEFAAGKEHYKNYKNYIFNGGLKGLANKTDLKIIMEIENRPLTSHLLILESN